MPNPRRSSPPPSRSGSAVRSGARGQMPGGSHEGTYRGARICVERSDVGCPPARLASLEMARRRVCRAGCYLCLESESRGSRGETSVAFCTFMDQRCQSALDNVFPPGLARSFHRARQRVALASHAVGPAAWLPSENPGYQHGTTLANVGPSQTTKSARTEAEARGPDVGWSYRVVPLALAPTCFESLRRPGMDPARACEVRERP